MYSRLYLVLNHIQPNKLLLFIIFFKFLGLDSFFFPKKRLHSSQYFLNNYIEKTFMNLSASIDKSYIHLIFNTLSFTNP